MEAAKPKRTRKRRGKMAEAPDPFPAYCTSYGLPAPTKEHRFHPDRRWRFDYAWPAERVALEVEGGVWTEGRHVRGAGFLGDVEKYNAAALDGWTLLRTTPDRLLTGETLDMLGRAMARAA